MSAAKRTRAPAAPNERTVACPSCGRQAAFAPSNPWRPFCSERCRLTDLGAWAAERHRIPGKPDPGAEGEKEG